MLFVVSVTERTAVATGCRGKFGIKVFPDSDIREAIEPEQPGDRRDNEAQIELPAVPTSAVEELNEEHERDDPERVPRPLLAPPERAGSHRRHQYSAREHEVAEL